jgi:O-methyltransferase involved in polyketide biosynthesis
MRNECTGATSDFGYKCDLSLPTWARDLTAAGFDPAKKTLWFMEGFTGYLEVDELRSLLK